VPDTLEPAEATVNEAAAALLAYMRRRDAGEQVDQAAFLLEHPHCAEELSAMLHWSERIRALRPSGNS
jgi:RNA polymerase sigma-70 factor (ECF subfamily)